MTSSAGVLWAGSWTRPGVWLLTLVESLLWEFWLIPAAYRNSHS
jgi:hypothetical protein